jgi:uncharacterized protein involved in exopolysaccharide biosynthesis
MQQVIDNSPMTDENQLADYLATARRTARGWMSLMLAIFVVSALIAYLLPPVYRSTGTILIEQQEIPKELVRSTVTTYADQRIQVISQQVMTRSNLQEIVRKYDLYADARNKEPVEVILQDMRADINLIMISADVVDPQSGRPTSATIAFTLSYENESPALAQKVANELASLYLNENLKTRRELATDAARFLTEEAEKLSATIAVLEGKLAVFKEKHNGTLPELMQTNLQLMNRTETQLVDVEREIRALDERIIYLESELLKVKGADKLYSDSGERVLSPKERLRALEAKYLSTAALYAENHPDLVRMRKEIEALKIEAAGANDSGPARGANPADAENLRNLITRLTQTEDVYATDHPDVKRLKREIEALQQKIQAAAAVQSRQEERDAEAVNPLYLQLSTQLKAAQVERATLLESKQRLAQIHGQYQKNIMDTPRVERDYLNLLRDYDNANAKYKEIKAKQMEAQLAMVLETERKGERFTLIDPPEVPEQPISPNRPAIVLLGLILSLAAGVGFVVMAKSLDTTVRGTRSLQASLGLTPLGVIPWIQTEQEARAGWHKRLVIMLAIALVIAGAAAAVHYFYLPLDVMWYLLLRRFEL